MIQEATVLSVLTSGRVWVRMSGRLEPVLTNSPAVRVEVGDSVLVGDIAGGRGNLAVIGLRSPVPGVFIPGPGWAFEDPQVAVSRTGETIRSTGAVVRSGSPGLLLGALPWGPPGPFRMSLPVDTTAGVTTRSVKVHPDGEVRLLATPSSDLTRVVLDLIVPA